MLNTIGLRREDMYAWERRTPLIPEHVQELRNEHGIDLVVETSPMRAHSDDEYRRVGVPITEDLSDRPVIVGLKEISIDALSPGTVYLFFSHTIKGQPFNMPMLQRCLDLGCTIIDYERIVDEEDRRLIFFGNYAGLAGMIDSLWTLGRRLAHEGVATPLADLKQASAYENLDEAKASIRRTAERIRTEGLPPEIDPLVVGIAGYGNVSRGAQEILSLLPTSKIKPDDLLAGKTGGGPIDVVIFKEEDTVLRRDAGLAFDLSEYYEHPERYRAAFSRYLPHLHTLVNCIYWEPKYPKLVTRADLRDLYREGQPKLRVIGDITCDVDGAIESTVKATESNDPVYVYDPVAHHAVSGVVGHGPVVMAVEILPSELPRESSAFFSGILKGFLPAVAAADFRRPLEESGLPPELRRATIAYRGALTPGYAYLETHLP